ncbi:unnamed protein product [Rotaria sp. Silwood1]|nr:unnamed protein product [Rotaria sp. Silwood1]CAF4805281.1 unnamed protein product [Rotaria sp. Silwood1]
MSASAGGHEWNPRLIEDTCDEPEAYLQPLDGYQESDLVSLEEAIEPIKSLFRNLPRDAWIAKNALKNPVNGLTPDEAAAIHLYTMETRTRSLYLILNEMLRDRDRRKLQPWFLYLKLFITALFKISPCSVKVLWRGVKSSLHSKYHRGQRYIWWAFSSCTLSLEVLEQPMYLGKTGTRTLFSIECMNGKAIKPYSYFQKEDEILLLPGFYFEVVGKVNAGNGLHIIQIREVTPPYVLLEHPFVGSSTSIAKLVIPLRSTPVNIHPNARWKQNGITVAGGNGEGYGNNQLCYPWGLYVDDDQTVYVTDTCNHRIMKWRLGETSGQVVAGGNKRGRGIHQLSDPFDVIVDNGTDSLIICDGSNQRVVRWPRRNGTSGETIISNVHCRSLTMDENGSLYVTAAGDDKVRRYRRGEFQETVVAGDNGSGDRLDQLSSTEYVFVDQHHSVYVSEWQNDRVMKWKEGAKQGTVVAGGHGRGNSLEQLACPRGVVVDQLGTVYVADAGNARIMRWSEGATQGNVIIGGNGIGKRSNQLHGPVGLSFDRYGNLYVVDNGNHRVQKFNLKYNG